MDGNMIKRISLIALGSLTGGVIGYFLGGLIVNQLEKVNEEWEYEDKEGVSYIPEDPQPEIPIEKGKKKTKDYTKFLKEKEDLSELVKPYTSSIVEGPKTISETFENIRIISIEQFENDRAHNKEPITYYEKDTTFSNAQEDIIDDPVKLFGPNIHLHFGEESEDPDMVYVRNEKNGVDYEIVRVHNSYSVIVMGMPEEPPKETKGKRKKNVRKVSAHDEDDNEDEAEE